MHISIVTPLGEVAQATAASVTAPGAVGEIGILPGHRPLLTSLQIGDLRYVQDGRTHHVAVSDGFIEVHDDRVIAVTQTAERPAQIDVDRASRSKRAALEQIESTDRSEHPELFALALAKLARAETRLAVAKQR